MDRLALIRDRALQVRIINGAFRPGNVLQPGPPRNLRPLDPTVNESRGNRSWTSWTGWRNPTHTQTQVDAMQARVTQLGRDETAMRAEISAAIDQALQAQNAN